jgi:hypothetical protein
MQAKKPAITGALLFDPGALGEKMAIFTGSTHAE